MSTDGSTCGNLQSDHVKLLDMYGLVLILVRTGGRILRALAALSGPCQAGAEAGAELRGGWAAFSLTAPAMGSSATLWAPFSADSFFTCTNCKFVSSCTVCG